MTASQVTRKPKPVDKRSGPVAIALVLIVALLGAGCTTDEHHHDLSVDFAPSFAIQRRALGPAQLRVIKPAAGVPVTSTFELEVAVENFLIAAPGRALDGEGHLHVLVDRPCVDNGQIIPRDEHHIHVANSRSKVSVQLDPGVYDLCVQLGDGFHNALAITDQIVVEVR